MPLVSASNENQAKYCALMFLGVSLKIACLRPAIFQIEYFKKGNLLQMPLVSASKEICNVRYIKVQVITHFQLSLISSMR